MRLWFKILSGKKLSGSAIHSKTLKIGCGQNSQIMYEDSFGLCHALLLFFLDGTSSKQPKQFCCCCPFFPKWTLEQIYDFFPLSSWVNPAAAFSEQKHRVKGWTFPGFGKYWKMSHSHIWWQMDAYCAVRYGWSFPFNFFSLFWHAQKHSSIHNFTASRSCEIIRK